MWAGSAARKRKKKKKKERNLTYNRFYIWTSDSDLAPWTCFLAPRRSTYLCGEVTLYNCGRYAEGP